MTGRSPTRLAQAVSDYQPRRIGRDRSRVHDLIVGPCGRCCYTLLGRRWRRRSDRLRKRGEPAARARVGARERDRDPRVRMGAGGGRLVAQMLSEGTGARDRRWRCSACCSPIWRSPRCGRSAGQHSACAEVALDGTVLAFALAVTVLTGRAVQPRSGVARGAGRARQPC